MTPNDENLLSAYLDEELDPGDRARVAGALRTDPALATRLRELIEVRGAIAGLSRPPAPDVSGSVLDRINHRIEARRGPVLLRPPVRVFASGLGLAATAALWLSMIYLGNRTPGPDVPVVAQAERPTVEPVALDAPADPPVSEPTVDPLPPPAETVIAAEPPAPPALAMSDEERARSESFARDLLTRRDVLRVDLRLGDAGPDELGRAIAESPRGEPDFGRLDLPGERAGVVFALTANRLEVDLLLQKLRERFGAGAIVGASPIERAVAVELADNGPFVVSRGLHAEVLAEPAAEVVASKSEPDPDLPSAGRLPGSSGVAPPVAESPRPEGPMAVLIWSQTPGE